jgi:hypothetical protein
MANVGVRHNNIAATDNRMRSLSIRALNGHKLANYIVVANDYYAFKIALVYAPHFAIATNNGVSANDVIFTERYIIVNDGSVVDLI